MTSSQIYDIMYLFSFRVIEKPVFSRVYSILFSSKPTSESGG